jgi:hypothetical protein
MGKLDMTANGSAVRDCSQARCAQARRMTRQLKAKKAATIFLTPAPWGEGPIVFGLRSVILVS